MKTCCMDFLLELSTMMKITAESTFRGEIFCCLFLQIFQAEIHRTGDFGMKFMVSKNTDLANG